MEIAPNHLRSTVPNPPGDIQHRKCENRQYFKSNTTTTVGRNYTIFLTPLFIIFSCFYYVLLTPCHLKCLGRCRMNKWVQFSFFNPSKFSLWIQNQTSLHPQGVGSRLERLTNGFSSRFSIRLNSVMKW